MLFKLSVSLIWFFLNLKLFLFWLWLWQLKEYHRGRFRAHFETQGIKKFLVSFYRFRYPKFTKKVVLIFGTGIFLEVFFLSFIFSLPEKIFCLAIFFSLILSPLIFSLLILFFQLPTFLFRKVILLKAEKKIVQFKKKGGVVIGITGSYGKSSTKEFLAEILSAKFNILKTEKNVNAEIGIAKTVLEKLKPDHEVFIAEIGAYERGKIKEVCQVIKPKIGILTGINQQHLSTFGSQENIVKGKFELIESLNKEGIGILNWDNDFIKNYFQRNKGKFKAGKIIKCSFFKNKKEEVDFWVENFEIDKEYLLFQVFSKNSRKNNEKKNNFKVNLLGKQNVTNILLAIACAKELGMSFQEIASACLKINSNQGGIKFLKKDKPVILDSSYSANPDGVLADLDYLKNYKGRKIVVMPCLIELGRAAGSIHREIGRKIGEVCDLAIITTNDYFKEIKKGAAETGMKGENILFIKNPDEIISRIKSCEINSVILLEGRIPRKIIDLLCDK